MSVPITNPAAERLVISLDFGTTFSGVAYAFNTPGKEADIVAIQDWPGEYFPLLRLHPLQLHTVIHRGRMGASNWVPILHWMSVLKVILREVILWASIPLEAIPLEVIQLEVSPLEVIPQAIVLVDNVHWEIIPRVI